MQAISVNNLSFRYPKQDKLLLKGISFSVDVGSFTLICGKTGCGKTTLLKHLKPEIVPNGEKEGKVEFWTSKKISPADIGFVSQNPDNQLVMDSVWHELAFGLENMGLKSEEIKRKIAETVIFFGLEDMLEKRIHELSGGQKQLVNLAAVMIMQPRILILDEPTAQLDPISAKNFLQAIKRVNGELGITVIMSEHRLEDELILATNAIYLENGEIKFFGEARELAKYLLINDIGIKDSVPSSAKVAFKLGEINQLPLSVKEAIAWINDKKPIISDYRLTACNEAKKILISVKNIWCRYSTSDYILKGMSIDIYNNEILAIVGGNGSGKTTLLKTISGILKQKRGRIKKSDSVRIGQLSQNPMLMLHCESVFDELMEYSAEFNYTKADVDNVMEKFGLVHLSNRHPFDLSGGEMQKTALAKLSLISPDVYLLDEPTKGLDAPSKKALARELKQLKNNGKTVVIVSHDLDFVASVSDRCAMLLDGEIVSVSNAKEFFDGNMFFTTGVNIITRNFAKGIVVVEDIR